MFPGFAVTRIDRLNGSIVKYLLSALALALVLVWSGSALYGGLYGWWLKPVAERGDVDGFFDAMTERVDRVPGALAFALIDDGQIVREYFHGAGVNRETLFPTASLSKWLTAYGVMRLVQQGRVELDRPVSAYLQRWQLPDRGFDNDQVTLRRVLSHTAGLTDGLGFGDYTADETVPSPLASLEHPRASGGRRAEISVGVAPGSEWKYSGGGYLLLQLLVEEVSGQGFADFMREQVFDPLEMPRASYVFLGTASNTSGSFDADGKAVAYSRYAADAATGLAASLVDLERFVLAQLQPSPSALPSQYVADMQRPLGRSLGADIWGAGVMLYAPVASGAYVFGHDGANDPAINSAVRINPDNGDAIVVLATGGSAPASTLGYHWVMWQTGMPDVLAFETALSSAIPPLLIGDALIVLGCLLLLFRRRRRKAAVSASQNQ